MRSVLITGSNKGIGFETALTFARSGYKVFATMRNTETATALKESVSKESLSILIYKMDVDSDSSVKECIDAIFKEHGAIDVLVNNAGIERHGSIEELAISDFKAIMETNYFGPIRCIQAVLPQMREKGSGCIINIGSIGGRISNTPLGAYSASKHAVEALTETLAQEVKQFNVRVAVVEPGIINTQMAQNISKPANSKYSQVLRFSDLFSASLKQPTPPSLVAETILGIANSNSWQLKYPVGPDALPFLQWRASMTDEEWTNWNAQGDDGWYDACKTTFGMDLRKV